MGVMIDKFIRVKNVSDNDVRVLTKDGKQNVGAGEEFITTEKEALQLVRMYGYIFEIVNTVEENEEIENENTDENETEENEETDVNENEQNLNNDNGEETSESEDNSDETEENVENTNDEEIENNEVEGVEGADDENEEETEIEALRNAYFEKYGAQVPVNKKNDVEWIKSKL